MLRKSLSKAKNFRKKTCHSGKSCLRKFSFWSLSKENFAACDVGLNRFCQRSFLARRDLDVFLHAAGEQAQLAGRAVSLPVAAARCPAAVAVDGAVERRRVAHTAWSVTVRVGCTRRAETTAHLGARHRRQIRRICTRARGKDKIPLRKLLQTYLKVDVVYEVRDCNSEPKLKLQNFGVLCPFSGIPEFFFRNFSLFFCSQYYYFLLRQ